MAGEIFISYARKDNHATRDAVGAKGMVAALHDRLRACFEALGPPHPTIFRDVKQIEGNQQFEPRLGEALRAAEVMVVVMSRNWLASDWCNRELSTFVEEWRRKRTLEQLIKERIFLVRKHAVDRALLPPLLQGQSGYDLVEVDKENDDEIEFFNADLGRVLNDQWFTRTEQLAKSLRHRVKNVADSLGQLSKTPPTARPTPEPHAANATTVYVAHPARDMQASYDTLVNELQERGFRVVPDPSESFSMDGEQVVRRIDTALSESRLSIHLLGDKAGFQPEDAAPIVRLQLEHAAAKLSPAQSDGTQDPFPFRRLLWAPRVMPGADESAAVRDSFEVLARHSTLPATSKREDALRQGDKLVGDTLTKFVQFVLQHIEEISRPQASLSLPVGGGEQVYIQHDEHDTDAGEAVAEGFARLGFAPVLPIIEGDTAERLRVHRDTLQTSDIVVLCWANAAPVWVRATASELRDWQSLGRNKAFVNRIAVALPPRKVDKERLSKFPPKSDLDKVIDATTLPSLTPHDLEPVLQILGERG